MSQVEYTVQFYFCSYEARSQMNGVVKIVKVCMDKLCFLVMLLVLEMAVYIWTLV